MAALTVLAVLVSTFVLVSPAQAAESIPTLKWSPAPTISGDIHDISTSPTGSATLPCTDTNGGSNLVSYSGTGVKTQDIPRTGTIDGVKNCIIGPVVDKNGTVYGVPMNTNGNMGPNLLAYNGNTLKWKYPAACNNGGLTSYVTGANGNIYTTHRTSSGDVRLIGLTPEVATGQTQPTKVLDIDVPNDCGELRAYKDGLVFHGQLSGNARYYSYAGKFLGQATIGDVWAEKLNADGKLFVGTEPTTGTYKSGKVSMYDPRTGRVEWEKIASTSGANVNGIQVYPVSGGGVVAQIQEQKMISGIPASPTQYITILKVLDSSGAVTKSMELPSTYSQGGITGTYGNGATYSVAIGQGKLAIVRKMYLNTGLSYPSTAQAIYVGVYDIASDSWTYQQVMRGDLTKAGGPSGYRLISDLRYGVTNDILYLSAVCTNNCADYNARLYALNIPGLSLDYPRGEVLAANTPTQPAPVSYVALGDSFSSGEGVEPFDDETNDAPYNMCHRSKLAYATLVSRNPSTPQTLETGAFRACSGAETKEIANSNPNHGNEPAQQNHVSSLTQTISITIGGNDIGFPAFGTACFWNTTTCRAGSAEYVNATNKINNVLPPKLRTAYANLLSKNGNSAKIYVMGYPHVAPVKFLNDPSEPSCPYLYHSGYDPNTGLPASWADAQAARDIVDQLNDAILTAVTAVKSENVNNANARLQFVNVNGLNSPFRGHEVCSDLDSYFLNVDQVAIDQNYIFHPNIKGQRAYADILADYIASH